MELGTKEISSHLDDGGSGQGYMNIFKILHNFKASLIIIEHEPEQCGFVKSVKVRFDGRGEYTIHTFRGNELLALQNKSEKSDTAPLIIVNEC